jgi:SSS family solute:Na+ symporter
LLYKFGWNGIVDTLVKEAQPGASMLNPFDQQADKIKDFNIFFFLILLFMRVYGHGSWQGSQGYRSAAKSAHEAKMAGILGEWRGGVTLLSSMLVPICAWVLMHNAFYANEASAVIDTLKQLPSGQIQKQMLVPMALPHMLPVGVTGMFAVVILAAAVSTDDTYLHSWGSIFVQDVIMPFRKKPFSTKIHMSLLRWAIIGVAAFAWTFSMLFPLQDYILMYFQLTGAIYIGGAGSVIIGGLYWKRGTTEGAWGGMITGSVIAVAGIVIRNCWGMLGLTVFAEKCPLNGVQMAFAAAIMAIIVYVVISLITCKKSFDLDAMLHRKGKNLDMGTHNSNRRKDWLGKIGITEEFTRFDIGIYLFKICWSGLWILAFVVGTTWALMGKSGIVPKTTDGGWAKWWYFQIIVCLIVGIGSAIWFIWGGFRDLIELFQILNNTERDLSDAGWVEENAPEKLEEIIENEMQLPDDPIIITERNSTSIRGNKD